MKTTSGRLKRLGATVIMLICAVIGTLPYILFKEQIRAMAGLGYLGLFVSCMLTNASVFLPASGIAFTLAATFVLNPLLCCLIGGIGTATGELVGYSFGYFGRKSIKHFELLSKAEKILQRYGFLAVLFFAFLPLPLFDLIGVGAGAAKLSVGKFYLVCCVGKVMKMLLYVFVIKAYLPSIEPL